MSEPLKIGLIGGSGLGQALGAPASGARHEIDTPFGKPSDAIIENQWTGVSVYTLFRHGPGHLLNPSQVPYRANIYALKMLGCTHVIASGAVGSLREEFAPRGLVIPEQIIDKTARRAGTFFEKAAVHVEFAEPFCPVLRQILLEAGKDLGADAPPVHDRGCYVAMEGPAFSTRAESLMHRLWGGDLIGMTLMPEAKLAREAEMAYAAVCLVTDYDCWRQPPPAAPGGAKDKDARETRPDPHVLLKEIIANLDAATQSAIRLIRKAVELMAARHEQLMQSPALRALELAIWSDKSKIPEDEVRRLGPLWIKYLERV
jgi:5'-methylthioadenosine phosphorylase